MQGVAVGPHLHPFVCHFLSLGLGLFFFYNPTISRINKSEIRAIYMSLFLREAVATPLHLCLYALACFYL